MRSTSGRVVILLAAIVAVMVLFVVLRDDDEEGTGTVSEPAQKTAPADGSAAPAEPQVPLILVKDGEPADGVADLQFKKGERIRFRVRSDVEDELHLHGYDISKDVSAGQTVAFDVPADIEGVFEVELEQSAVLIAEITVSPG